MPLQVGAVGADVVAVEARLAASWSDIAAVEAGAGESGLDRHRPVLGGARAHRVVSLTQRRLTDSAAVIAGLPTDLRPAPRVDIYDELLPKRRPSAPDIGDAVATTQESAS